MGKTAGVLIPSSAPAGPATGPMLVMSVRGSSVAVATVDDLPADRPGALFVGTVAGRQCWAVDAEADGVTDAGAAVVGSAGEPGVPAPGDPTRYVDLMSLYGSVDEATWAAAGRAVQLVGWARDHRFCGRCGTPTEDSDRERARRCPACGLLAFPRLAPAVITLVERGDGRALLARNANWPASMFSCLAGFVEPGETVEEALRREVLEEVGIRIGAVHYFGSQPWPFPHSLMLGFHADYADGVIRCNEEEIAEAAWYAPDALPGIPGPISIARRLIDDWVSRSTGS